jgi:hypothetical protein
MPIVAAVGSAVASQSGSLGDAVLKAQTEAVEKALARGVSVHDAEVLRQVQIDARDEVVRLWKD